MNEKHRHDSAVRVPWETAPDIRLLVLDLDGTIVDESNRIGDAVAQAIHSVQRRGVAVAIATGRLYLTSLQAYDFIGSDLPLICCEGALVRERTTGVVHRDWPLEPGFAAEILDRTEPLSLSRRLSVHFYIHDDVYVSNLDPASIKYFEGSKIEPIVVSDLRRLLGLAITKVLVLSDDVQVIERLARQLKNSNSRTRVKQYKSIPFLELFNSAVNKALAVSYLAEEMMALRPENVMAIGDDSTDIEMIQYAGIGIAMGNAPLAVQACADWITTTIEKDGVVRAIERWILSAESNPAPTHAHGVG